MNILESRFPIVPGDDVASSGRLDKTKMTQLHCACENGNFEEVKRLLASKRKKFMLTFRDEDNLSEPTPLFVAVSKARSDLVEILLQINPSEQLGVQNFLGMTPMYYACEKGFLEVAKVLVSMAKYVDVVNAESFCGWTPIFAACQGGHLEIVEWLVEMGADLSKKVHKGLTPFLVACQGDLEVVKWIHGRVEGALLRGGGMTALSLASEEGNFEVVRWLIRQGVGVDVANANGETPLLLACKNGHLSLVRFLVKEGDADVNVQSSFGLTPLFVACQDGHFEIAQFLLQQGSKSVPIRDRDRTEPLGITIMNGFDRIVSLFPAQS